MDFNQALSSLTQRVPGAVAAGLIGNDGLPVAQVVQQEGFDRASVAAEVALLLNNARRSARNLELGGAAELSVVTDDLVLLTRSVTKDYFLLLAVDSSAAVLGKGRYELRRAVPAFQRELG